MTNLTNIGPCFLYGLLDPRSQSIFYIGTSAKPVNRLPSHRSDPSSAAFKRCRDIIDSGFQPELKILHECKDRNAALHLEYQLIKLFPILLNRARDFYQIGRGRATHRNYIAITTK